MKNGIIAFAIIPRYNSKKILMCKHLAVLFLLLLVGEA